MVASILSLGDHNHTEVVMNSDAILRELNRLANDNTLTSRQRSIITQAMAHIRKQDDDVSEIRDDISKWRVPKDASQE